MYFYLFPPVRYADGRHYIKIGHSPFDPVIASSFGGLLMRLTGDQRHLSGVQPDMRLYLLLKKD